MNAAGGAAYGAADDFMQCPACHGFGHVDSGSFGGGRGNRRSRGAARGGNSQGSSFGVILLLGLGYFAFKWLGDNKQVVTDALWTYVVLPIGALVAAVAAFFLLRFLWRCGKWSIDGMLRYGFNFVVLTFFSAAASFVILGAVVAIVPEVAQGFELSPMIGRAGLVLITALAGLLLTAQLSQKYGRLGYAWDLLRGRNSAATRQVSNALLPLLKKPNGGWIGAAEWNDPYVRGFLSIQVGEFFRARWPHWTEEKHRAESEQLFRNLLHRSHFRSGNSSGLLPSDALEADPRFREGQLAGLMFLRHYHRIDLDTQIGGDVRNAVATRYENFTGALPKPRKMRRPGFARVALVKHLWHPHLTAISAVPA